MPALITHYLHARKIYENIAVQCDGGRENRRLCLPDDDSSPEKRAFLLGAQGPDFLFFHRIVPIVQFGKSLRKVGVKMHKIPADRLFSAFAQYCRERADYPNTSIAAAYSAGFLCHYMLDCAVHPFVYAMQKAMIQRLNITYFDGCVHSRIEHSLDVILLEKMNGQAGNTFDYDKALCKDERILSECSAMISFALEKTLKQKISAEKIMRGFKDYRNLANFTRDEKGRKYRFFRRFERIFHLPPSLSTFIRTARADCEFDYANFSHGEWRNPYDEHDTAHNSDFLQIFEQSVHGTEAAVMHYLSAVKNGGANMTFIGRKSYKTGLEISENADFDDTYQ